MERRYLTITVEAFWSDGWPKGRNFSVRLLWYFFINPHGFWDIFILSIFCSFWHHWFHKELCFWTRLSILQCDENAKEWKPTPAFKLPSDRTLAKTQQKVHLHQTSWFVYTKATRDTRYSRSNKCDHLRNWTRLSTDHHPNTSFPRWKSQKCKAWKKCTRTRVHERQTKARVSWSPRPLEDNVNSGQKMAMQHTFVIAETGSQWSVNAEKKAKKYEKRRQRKKEHTRSITQISFLRFVTVDTTIEFTPTFNFSNFFHVK